jgi:hypothetical protein
MFVFLGAPCHPDPVPYHSDMPGHPADPQQPTPWVLVLISVRSERSGPVRPLYLHEGQDS